jgi:hypothetical protein
MKTRVQASDDISSQTIVDPCAIVLTKDEPGLALRIPDDVLSTIAGTSDEEGPGERWAHGLFFS